MSMSRSSASLALLRSLSKTAASPQVSRICLDCLRSPASCQISSIINAASPGYAASSSRWQSTSSIAATPLHDAPPPIMPLGDASTSTSGNPEEIATIPTTSASTQTTSKPALPSLEDLEALKTRKLKSPSEASPADSPEVGLYTRRFKRMSTRVSKAFNREQLLHLARLAKLEDVNMKMTKTAIVHAIVTQYWGFIDPAQIAARDAERRKLEASTPKDVTEDIPVSEKELFFLLSKGPTAHLFRQLAGLNKHVKVSIRSSPSGSLQFTGPAERVKVVLEQWNKLRKGIKTEIVDTPFDGPLRMDLYKSLSLQADAFITPKGKRSTKLEVSHRTESGLRVKWTEACLRYLAVQTATMQHSPRFALLDADTDDNAYLPVVPENTLPWDLRALPTLAISRYTKLSPASGSLKLYRAQSQSEEADVGELQDALFGPLEDRIGTLQFSASFGNLLRIAPGASLDSLDQSVKQEWASQSDDVFIPASHNGFANRYSLPLRRVEARHIEDHTQGLDVTSTYVRRLTYVTDDVSLPLRIMKFEKEVPNVSRESSSSSAESGESEAANTWKGEHGWRSVVHVSMPHSLTDVRLEATKMQPVTEDALTPLANVTRNSAPLSITMGDESFYLLDDVIARSTKFNSGIPEPFASYKETLEPILERRTDVLYKQRSTALELRGRSPEHALKSLAHMLQHT